MLVSENIKKAVAAEIKSLESIKKALEKHSKQYGVDHTVEIAQLEESIENYTAFMKQ